jgi:hypothetical protein
VPNACAELSKRYRHSLQHSPISNTCRQSFQRWRKVRNQETCRKALNVVAQASRAREQAKTRFPQTPHDPIANPPTVRKPIDEPSSPTGPVSVSTPPALSSAASPEHGRPPWLRYPGALLGYVLFGSDHGPRRVETFHSQGHLHRVQQSVEEVKTSETWEEGRASFPRTITVYSAKLPGDDDWDRGSRYFRKVCSSRLSQGGPFTHSYLCSPYSSPRPWIIQSLLASATATSPRAWPTTKNERRVTLGLDPPPLSTPSLAAKGMGFSMTGRNSGGATQGADASELIPTASRDLSSPMITSSSMFPRTPSGGWEVQGRKM